MKQTYLSVNVSSYPSFSFPWRGLRSLSRGTLASATPRQSSRMGLWSGVVSQVAPLPGFVLDRIVQPTPVAFVPSVLLPFVDGWVRSFEQNFARGRARDEATRQVSRVLYTDLAVAASSSSQLCREAGVSHHVLEAREGRLASAMLLCEQMQHRGLELAFADARSRGVHLHMLLEAARYDETPMRVKATAHEDSRALLESAIGGTNLCSFNDVSAVESVERLTLAADRLHTSLGPQKILHIESTYAFLLSVPSEVGREFICVVRAAPRRLFHADRMTGETIAEALRRSSLTTRAGLAFDCKARVVCADKAGNNTRAEGGFSAQRRAVGFGPSCMLNCEVHIVASVVKHMTCDMQEEITGIIRVALSLQLGAHMMRFRRIVREVVMSSAVIRVGSPPDDAVRYRARVLQLFAGRGHKAVQKLTALSMLPNGDWRDRDSICIFVSPAVRASHDDARLKSLLAYGIEYALASRAPHLYSKHRWTGFDVTLDALGLLSLCHGILEKAYPKFVESFRPATKRPDIEGNLEDLPAISDADPGMGAPPVQLDSAPGEGDQAADVWQQENEKSRRLGLRFVSMGPEAFIILMRLVYEPMRKLLSFKLAVADEDFEAARREAERQALAGGTSDQHPREYRILLSARSVAEQNALRKLRLLYDEPEMWQLMPESALTEDWAGRAFRLCSRQGALVQELLIEPQRRYPYRLFLALEGEVEAAKVSSDPWCMRCPFSAHFLQQTDLCTDLGIAKLRMLAMLCRQDIAQVECHHASLRRLIRRMGLQTHTPDMCLVTSRWMASKWRQEQHGTRTFRWAPGPDADEEPEEPGEPEEGAAPRTGGGGEWRAFVHRRTQGQQGRPDLRALGEEYRRLRPDEEERAGLQELGAAGTRAHREDPSRPAFGPTGRQIAVATEARAREGLHAILDGIQSGVARARRMSDMVLGDFADSVDLTAALRVAGGRSRSLAQVAAQRVRERVSALRVFAESGFRHAADRLSQLVVVPSPWRMPLMAVPDRSMPVFELRSQARSTAENLVAWTFDHDGKESSAPVASQAGAALAADWAAQVDAIQHDRCEPISASDLPRSTPCADAGLCVCRGEGARLRAFRLRFLKALAMLFPKDAKDELTRLRHGHFFAMIVGVPSGAETDPASQVEVLFHISLMYLSPWRPTLQRIEIMTKTASGDIEGRATGEWYSLWRAFQTLDFTYTWGLQVYMLLERRSPVVFFSPATVAMRKPSGITGEFVHFWTPSARRGRRAPGPIAMAAVEDRLDAIAIDEGAGDDDAIEGNHDEVSSNPHPSFCL